EQIDCLNLRSIALDVNAPAHNEGYHATWRKPLGVMGEEMHFWSAVLPLTAWGQDSGQVAVTGHPDSEPMWEKLAVLSRLTDGIETVLSPLHSAPVSSNGAAVHDALVGAGRA